MVHIEHDSVVYHHCYKNRRSSRDSPVSTESPHIGFSPCISLDRLLSQHTQWHYSKGQYSHSDHDTLRFQYSQKKNLRKYSCIVERERERVYNAYVEGVCVCVCVCVCEREREREREHPTRKQNQKNGGLIRHNYFLHGKNCFHLVEVGVEAELENG